MRKEFELSEFLEVVSPIHPLHHRELESFFNSWVFWSEDEGSQNNSSSSADLGTPVIHEEIKSVLLDLRLSWGSLTQFWAPVTIDGKRLLSTSGQPFAVDKLYKELAKYRVYSEKYKYKIDDVNQLDNYDGDHMSISGGPASVFLNRLPSINQLKDCDDVYLSFMIPICFPSQSSCIGVLEFALEKGGYELVDLCLDTVTTLKKVGLDVFHVQDVIPYKTVSGLNLAKDKIQEALKVICESHNLPLAQVWISHEAKNNVPFSYTMEETQTKQLFAVKLTGYLYAVVGHYDNFEPYFRLGDVIPRVIGEECFLMTIQDYESRYISKLCSDMFMDWEGKFYHETSVLAICLRSNDTGDFNYVFEFIWPKQSKHVNFLEALLLTLKRCLPNFKFASGAELGDELDIIKVSTYTDSEETGSEETDSEETDKIIKLKVFQPKTLEKGKKPMVVENVAPSKKKHKTTKIIIQREEIEKQFGKTMDEAARSLNVSSSTLKRKLKELGIGPWSGPKFVKKNTNDLSIFQIDRTEEYNRPIQDPSTFNMNENRLTIKAEYENEIIKFRLPKLGATFVTVEKKIGMEFKLSLGTYKLQYLDDAKEWIRLASDEDMNYCIESSIKNEVRLRVLPSTQPISSTS